MGTPIELHDQRLDGLVLDVVTAIGEEEGVHPAELTPPLYEVLDGDGLERYLRASSTAQLVRFEYNGYTVTITVDADGSYAIDLERT